MRLLLIVALVLNTSAFTLQTVNGNIVWMVVNGLLGILTIIALMME